MSVHDLAGQRVPRSLLENIPQLIAAYYTTIPDLGDPTQLVSFGTSGHRGSSLDGRFNEAHILATTQAICDHRQAAGINGPVFLAKDTHALSEPAFITALEVLAGNGVQTCIAHDGLYTPTPALSHAILRFNAGKTRGLSDGIVITPSHNPPRDGGFKYNPPSAGPAGGELTGPIQQRANELLRAGLSGVQRVPYGRARTATTTHPFDYVTPYVEALPQVVDLEAIRSAGLKLGAEPLGGAGVFYWGPIVERFRINVEVISDAVDPTFSFMHLDHDGKIRMDCSSRFAMAGLIALKDRFDIAFGNDTDYDRHGIVTRSAGLLNPNHFLAVAIDYLFRSRTGWEGCAIGKTAVSSSMIDRVAAGLERTLLEVPVGFKHFVPGLLSGQLGFGGEESAGASFLCMDKSPWSTDKDGIILDLLAAEIMAKTGKDPGEHYVALTERYGAPCYERIDAACSREEKEKLQRLSPEKVSARTLAGEAITQKLTRAPGNNEELGGLKVVTENGWFAARPSGTEDVYKIYAESFLGEDHLRKIQDEARDIVANTVKS